MTLQIKAIDRLFERLSATYGADWTRKWIGVPMSDVKTSWAHELAGFGNKLEAVAWALENLPAKCPNVIEFREICRRAPEPVVPRLPEPKPDIERLQKELEKLQEVRANPPQNTDGRAWARKLINRHEAGEKLNPTTLRFAQEAMING